ncbi:hypothetical protein B0H03_11864 [Rathayibacter iranicus NCPPB 2253 = VKM Ac-1602]|uniref:Uncharacterized protein n=1 Tax=Rathayibacter iranicus NCPPB 2253 = VKM Ac-1602 TaxID=1328868 RepID=A0ABX5LC48_9MICO|nr:hypothetical protein B0H03_11864 [Rathayibacter iranicus NCPPB 2253 = VKM Ac-1602]
MSQFTELTAPFRADQFDKEISVRFWMEKASNRVFDA